MSNVAASSEESLEALALFDLGLHVCPILRGSKKPHGKHKFLNTSRLQRSALAGLCDGNNLSVRAGRLSGNLVIVDPDTFEDFDRLDREFKARNLRPRIRNSVRGGQFWFFLEDGEAANAVWRNEHGFEHVDVLGHDLYTLAPPSVHPTGMVYEWLDRTAELPTFPLSALISFLPIQLRTRCRREVRGEKRSSLPDVADKVLFQKDVAKYGGDNSAAEYAACLSLITAGWTDTAIMDLVSEIAPLHYRKTGDRNFAKNVLAKARVWAAEHPQDPEIHAYA